MKKLLLLLALCIASSAVVSAQEKEKVVTGTISMYSPTSVSVLDEYVSSQLYTGSGVFNGLNVKLGAFYKKHDNLSWNLYYTGFHRQKTFESLLDLETLLNPSGSQELKYSAWNFGYGTYYHWQFDNRLMVKVGGMCDFYGEYKEASPDGINNNINMHGQIMLKANAAIKYGWEFKKWALDLRANVTIPIIGLITADHPSEPALFLLGNDHSVMNPAMRHIFLGFYHNYMSLDYELGVDFVFKPLTLQLALGSTNRWWNVYGVQNIRKINYMSLGFAFDIVGRNKFKSSNNNF